MRSTRLVSIFLMVLSVSGYAEGQEKVTFQELVDDVKQNLQIKPGKDAGLTEADIAAIRKRLSRADWASTAPKGPFENLPEGTRAAVLGRPIVLTLPDAASCELEARAYLMTRIGAFHVARRMPVLSPAEKQALKDRVEDFLVRAEAALAREIGSYVPPEKIRERLDSIRVYLKAGAADPTLVLGKVVPPAERFQELCDDYASRLTEAGKRIPDLAARRVPPVDDQDYEVKKAQFISLVIGDTIEPLRTQLAKLTSIDEKPFAEDLERAMPGYWALQREVTQLHLKQWEAARERQRLSEQP